MFYVASCTVILNDGELQEVEAMGDSRNEALINLGNAATGINVVRILPSSIATRVVK